MRNDELEKKLSILKTSSVPKGYWENYWPRLKMKLEANPAASSAREMSRGDERTIWRWAIPSLAIVFVGVLSFYSGRRHAQSLRVSNPDILLASETGQDKAQRVFREMVTLFPDRVNWISFVDGKVDFSISSVAFKDSQVLIPFVVSLVQGSNVQHAQLIIRPGQEAMVHAPWADGTMMDLLLRLPSNASPVSLELKLTKAAETASLQGATSMKEGESVVLGSIRWKGQLTQIHLARARKETPQSNREKHEPI